MFFRSCFFSNLCYNAIMIQFNINFGVLKSVKHYRLLSYTRQKPQNSKNFEHMHPHAEIFFVTEGKGYFRTANETIKVQKGMVIINNPHVRHTDAFSEDSNFEYAVFAITNIAFTQDSNSRDMTLIDIIDPTKTDTKSPAQTFSFDYSFYFDEIFDFLRVIESESCEKKPFWDLGVLNEFDKFMLFLFRHSTLLSLPYNSEQKKPSVANSVHFYLNASYADDITLDKLSNLFYTNKYYLAHTFKKTFGISPIAYLNKLRCEKAKTMLETTDLSITAIATSVGFASISHFSETYKKYLGASPMKTRKDIDNSPIKK